MLPQTGERDRKREGERERERGRERERDYLSPLFDTYTPHDSAVALSVSCFVTVWIKSSMRIIGSTLT